MTESYMAFLYRDWDLTLSHRNRITLPCWWCRLVIGHGVPLTLFQVERVLIVAPAWAWNAPLRSHLQSRFANGGKPTKALIGLTRLLALGCVNHHPLISRHSSSTTAVSFSYVLYAISVVLPTPTV